MTAQVSDRLINEHPTVDLDGLFVYGIICGDLASNSGWGDQYEFQHKTKDRGWASSACWRGHVKTYLLSADGQLRLVGCRYPMSDIEAEELGELATGDFWMVMKPDFWGRRVYIPFRNGRVIENQGQWLKDLSWAPMKDAFRKALEDFKSGKMGIELGSYIKS